MRKKEVTSQAIKIATANSFDDLYNRDKEEVKKEVAYTQAKEGKKMQLVNALTQTQAKITKIRNEYQSSLTDVLKDSINLKIDLLSAEKEYEIGKQIFMDLFPEHANLVASK